MVFGVCNIQKCLEVMTLPVTCGTIFMFWTLLKCSGNSKLLVASDSELVPSCSRMLESASLKVEWSIF